jgi:hypothetical protein
MPQSYTGQFLAKSLGMDKPAVADKGKGKVAKAAKKATTRKRTAA